MSCQNFEAIIIGMARAQLLEAGARREALAHLAQCATCADKFAEQQALTAAMRATARSLVVRDASATVEHKLRTAFRVHITGSATPVPVNAFTQRWQSPRRVVFAAAAAVLLVTFFVGWVWQRTRVERKPVLASAPHVPANPVPSNPDAVPERFPAPHLPVPESRRQVALKPRQVRGAMPPGQPNEEEMTAGFIALAEEGELVPLESGQVLRVELSTSTLISMGLPILAEDVSKPVLADLLLGQDGMARAIRFVKPGVAADVGAPQSANNR
jgi:hypothetical protein